MIRNFTQFQNYIAPVTWGSVLFFGVFHNPSRFHEHAPIPEGHSPPILTDVMVIRILSVFGIAYMFSFFWFFVRTGILERDYKRDFTYEELYETTEANYIHVEGGRRKVARFEV